MKFTSSGRFSLFFAFIVCSLGCEPALEIVDQAGHVVQTYIERSDGVRTPTVDQIIEATGEGDVTVAQVTLSPDAKPVVAYKRISREGAARMDRARELAEPADGASAAAPDDVGSTEQALSVSSVCSTSATWLYDQPNHTGNRLCITGWGKLDLNGICRIWEDRYVPALGTWLKICTARWWDSTGVVKSVLPGVEDGSLLAERNGEPIGLCADQCTSWRSLDWWRNLDGPILGVGGQCLDVQWANSANGTPVWMWPCNGGVAQQWHRTEADEIRILGLGGKCLDVRDGTSVRIYDCNGSDSQRWVFPGDGSIRPVSNIARCLDVAYGGTSAGTAVNTITCNPALPNWAPQVWDFAPCANSSRWIEQHVWGKGCWLDGSGYSALGDDPQNQEYNWTRSFQGLTTTPTEWYTLSASTGSDFTIYDTSKSRRLGSTTDSQATYSRAGWRHAGGDLDWFQGILVPHGYLFVPMEQPPSGFPGNSVAVGVVDPITRVWSLYPIDTVGHMSWLAINPRDQLLYTSQSGDPGDARVFELRAYSVSVPGDPTTATFAKVKTIRLKDENGVPLDASTGLMRVSGGGFSANGHLYITSWDQDTSRTGVYGFDIETGRRRVFLHVAATSDGCQELEGLTVDPNTPFAGGAIHVGLWGRGDGNPGVYCPFQWNNIWLKHFGIFDPTKL